MEENIRDAECNKILCIEISIPQNAWKSYGQKKATGGDNTNDVEAGVDDTVAYSAKVHRGVRSKAVAQEGQREK